MTHFRIIFVVLALTGLLIITIGLRSRNSKNFYHFRKAVVEQSRLKQSLYQHQIQLEVLTTSASVTEFAEEANQ